MKESNKLFERFNPSYFPIDESFTYSISFKRDVWLRFKKNPGAILGVSILAFLLIMSLIGPYLNSYTYYSNHLEFKNSPPSKEFWFGTDDLGRDIFTRVWWGARISLLVGFSAASIDLVLGIIWGTVAALMGSKVDEMMMRLCDVLYAIPYLLTVILLTVVIGPGLATIIFAITLTGWISMARIVRGQIFQLKQQDYILAAVALGSSKKRLIFKHLIPNAIGPIVTTMTLTIPAAIFTEAFLSFLGLGVQAPIASWGVMISDAIGAMRYYPWRLFFPATFITLTIFSLNLLGDNLRDVLDPRYKN